MPQANAAAGTASQSGTVARPPQPETWPAVPPRP